MEHLDSFVCTDCFEDETIKNFIRENSKDEKCTFCGAESDKSDVASLVVVLPFIEEKIHNEYDRAINCLPYDEDTEDGYFPAEKWQTEELLESIFDGSLPNDENGKLMSALIDMLGDDIWCRKAPFSLTDNERFELSWKEFCNLVKHHRRYFFLHEKSDDTELYSPSALLDKLILRSEDFRLIETLPKGKSLYRARFQKIGVSLSTVGDLGPPPVEKAVMSNRMSPPGIVMFYASEDIETALRETAIAPGRFAVGEFEILHDVLVLNLASKIPVPSIFEPISDIAGYIPRPFAQFLNYFVDNLSKPIERDDRPHIEYIPTQIVTEYFRVTPLPSDKKIRGIRYRSAQHLDHYSLVLFANQDDLVGCKSDNPNSWIKLVGPKPVVDVTADDLNSWRRRY